MPDKKHFHFMPGHLCCPPKPMIIPPILLAQGILVPGVEYLPTPLLQVIGSKKYQILPVTTADQVISSSGSSVETRLTILERSMATAPSHYEVATIAQRDAIPRLVPGDTVYVADATADASVSKGGASYVYQKDGTWRKDSEDESMDQVCIAISNNGSIPDDLREGGLIVLPLNI